MTGRAFIWDLDGTLLDSYGVIVSSLQDALAEFRIPTDPETVFRQVKDGSVSTFLKQAAAESGVPYQQFKDRYSAISGRRVLEIPAMVHARETLDALAAQGHIHLVYTHRGQTTDPVLENLDLRHYFKEVVTSLSGFPRKPSPDALLYLIEKHGLEKDQVCYVGDRALDMECARNAGVRGVFFSPSGIRAGDCVVRDLLEIQDIAEA